MLAEIRQLLELQRIDDRIVDATARLARLENECRRLEARINEKQTVLQSSRDALSQLRHDSRMKNLEVDELDMQIREYQKRLDKGIISFKEMEDLRAKIESERGRISRLEDEALSLMDAVEEHTREQSDAEAETLENEEMLRQQMGETRSEIEETHSRMSELATERVRVAAEVPSYLLTQYETLHAKLAHPVAEIRSGICGGCKLRVSDTTTERARSEMGVVVCEHCSRILYTA